MTFLLYGKECVSIQWGNHRNLSDLRRGTQVAMVCINERTKGAIKKKKINRSITDGVQDRKRLF